MTIGLPLQGPQFQQQDGLYRFSHGKYARDMNAKGRQLLCTVTEECTYRTTVWHVDDGSAEEEFSRHYAVVHGKVKET